MSTAPGTGPDSPATLHAGPVPERPARGAVLVLAGGGYEMRAEHEDRGYAEFLAAHGLRTFWLDYPVAPARYPHALYEVLAALADLRTGRRGGAPVDGPVALLGSSAGGHLAGTAATATDEELADVAALTGADPAEVRRPDAVALCYPVVSLVDHPHLGSRLALLGTDDDAPARALSVDRRVDDATPPAFLWHTAEDGSVDVRHTLLAVAALHEHGVPVEAHVYPHGPHGMGLAAGTTAGEWSRHLLRWLDEQGIGAAG